MLQEVEFREDGRERLIKLDTPEGVQDYGDRLLEEADPRAKPFDHAYSWKKHVHPFEGKMSDVTVRFLSDASLMSSFGFLGSLFNLTATGPHTGDHQGPVQRGGQVHPGLGNSRQGRP